jgi:hypothetical protein
MATNPDYDTLVRSMGFDEKVEFFFGATSKQVTTGHIHSTLALIVNDIRSCAEHESNSLAFPRAMCLMVTIDLLAKMCRGTDIQTESGSRFIEFTEFALHGTKFGTDIGEKIYAFRCALHHSYRLPTEWKPKGSKTKVAWRFRLIEDHNEPRLTWDDGCTFINLYRLHQEITGSIPRFHAIVSAYASPKDRKKFQSMFDKYGWLYVGD